MVVKYAEETNTLCGIEELQHFLGQYEALEKEKSVITSE
jgi:hypothetical protein